MTTPTDDRAALGLPYLARLDDPDQVVDSRDFMVLEFDPSTSEADRAFILRACNSHHSLTNALRDCLESLRRLPDVDGAYRVTCIAEAEAALAGGNVPQSNVALAAAKEDGK